jgi:hypothetical protein
MTYYVYYRLVRTTQADNDATICLLAATIAIGAPVARDWLRFQPEDGVVT